MSRAVKRKHVLLHVLDDDTLPTPGQQIVKVFGTRGNNLHEVLAADGAKFLVSMPTKFRRNLWIKRGDFVLIDPIEEGDKVKGEIVRMLTPELVKYFKKEGVWPSAFDDVKRKSEQDNNEECCSSDNSEDDEEEDSSSDSESGDESDD